MFGSSFGVHFNKPKSQGGQGAESEKVRNQRLPFMFEALDDAGGITAQYILPIAPENYAVVHAPRASVTLTKGGAHEDIVGHGLPKISLSGTFGFLGTLLPGTGERHILGDKKDGWALFEELSGTFQQFYKDWESGKKPQFNFYDYTARDYFRVQINTFKLQRSAQRRMLVVYDIQMTALKRVEPLYDADRMKEIMDVLDRWYAPTGPSATAQWLETAMNGYAAVNGALYSVTGAIGEVGATVSQIADAIAAARNEISGTINLSFSAVTETVANIDSILATVTSLQEVPHEITKGLRDLKRDLMGLKAQRASFIESTVTGPTPSSASVSGVEVLSGPDVAAPGVSTETVPEETLFSVTQETRQISAKEVAIEDGDTIQTIAAKNGVEWTQLAALNDLDTPYIGGAEADRYSAQRDVGKLLVAATTGDTTISAGYFSGLVYPGAVLVFRSVAGQISAGDQSATVLSTPSSNTIIVDKALTADLPLGTEISVHDQKYTVLLPGETIQVPGDVKQLSIFGGAQTFDDKMFGIDEELDSDGNMVATPAGDISVVAGITNLEMALRHRINTARGELRSLGHPEYGSRLHEIIGKVGNEMWRERAMLEAELAVRQDPRIERIVGSDLIVDGTGFFIDIRCTVVGKATPEQFRLPVA